MSAPPNDGSRAIPPDAAPLFARAAGADRRADARLATAIDDFFLAEDDRLDDRTRAAIAALMATTVNATEREIVGHAARLLGSRGELAPAGAPEAPVLPRLIESGLLRDAELMGELLGQVRQDLLGEALAANRAPGAGGALLARLTQCGDGVVEGAATDYLLAESRRRAPSTARRTELPAALHHRIVWWVAAALRERHHGPDQPTIDRALADAAVRSLSAHDESDRLEAVALRLAAAIDARPDELAALLTDTLEEGRAALLVAVIAHAQAIDFAEAREIVLDPDGDRLWLALRARGLERETIARVGLALSDADHRRDLESFADQLDTIAEIAPQDARESLAPLALHRDFRAAVRALRRSGRR